MVATITRTGRNVSTAKINNQTLKSRMDNQYMEKKMEKKRSATGTQDKDREYKKPKLVVYTDDIDNDIVRDNVNTNDGQTTSTTFAVPERAACAKLHDTIRNEMKDKNYIRILIELPRRCNAAPPIFRIDKSDNSLIIIVDDRNVEYVFGPSMKKYVDKLTNKTR